MFKKKTKTYSSESKWTVLKGQQQGHPMLVRRNDSAKELLGNLEYKYRFGVAVVLLKPNESGFPTTEEMKSLNLIEDELSNKFESKQMAILVLAITTNGMREFVFYCRNPQIIESSLNEIQAKFPSYNFQSYFQEDKDWKLYKEFEKEY
ncbi:MAG: DUF695 domain-containing protein [Dehalococcoidales bacterium]|nr:DUF695 domain-containing protein [Dehalococcoidales bacterium]